MTFEEQKAALVARWTPKPARVHEHRFRLQTKPLRVPGWLGHPGAAGTGEPIEIQVLMCLCGEPGYAA
jgi:hypothetical protein